MSSKELKGPDFIGIGMERAGTSWLFTQLAFHPEIWVPPLKELHFFDVIDPKARYLTHRYSYHLKSRLKQKAAPFMDMPHRPEFQKNSYGEYLRWDCNFFCGKFNVEWYKRLFAPRFTKGRVCGEFTPAYSNLTQDTIRLILDMNPNVKFLLMVRNPIQRLWSGLVHHFRHVENRRFETVTEDQMIDFLKNSAAMNRSDLASILETWQQNVDPRQLFIQPFEAISLAPSQLIQLTYEFLGVDTEFLPPEEFYLKKINAYTEEDFETPPRVAQYLQESCARGLDVLKRTHPEIVQNWIDGPDTQGLVATQATS